MLLIGMGGKCVFASSADIARDLVSPSGRGLGAKAPYAL